MEKFELLIKVGPVIDIIFTYYSRLGPKDIAGLVPAKSSFGMTMTKIFRAVLDMAHIVWKMR